MLDIIVPVSPKDKWVVQKDQGELSSHPRHKLRFAEVENCSAGAFVCSNGKDKSEKRPYTPHKSTWERRCWVKSNCGGSSARILLE